NSRAIHDRDVVERNFPDQSAHNYHPFSQNRLTPKVEVIFRSRKPMAIFNQEVLEEMKDLCDAIRSIVMSAGDQVYTYRDLCAKANGDCYVDGGFLLTDLFRNLLSLNKVTYPKWTPIDKPVDMRRLVGNVTVTNGILQSANSITLGFPLRRDTPQMERLSLKWESHFLRFMETVNCTK
ncbi:hypothetical protein EGW08_019698, partial [Elysia chlorotica]